LKCDISKLIQGLIGIFLIVSPEIYFPKFRMNFDSKIINDIGILTSKQKSSLRKTDPEKYYYFKTFERRQLLCVISITIGYILIYRLSREYLGEGNEWISYLLSAVWLFQVYEFYKRK